MGRSNTHLMIPALCAATAIAWSFVRCTRSCIAACTPPTSVSDVRASAIVVLVVSRKPPASGPRPPEDTSFNKRTHSSDARSRLSNIKYPSQLPRMARYLCKSFSLVSSSFELPGFFDCAILFDAEISSSEAKRHSDSLCSARKHPVTHFGHTAASPGFELCTSCQHTCSRDVKKIVTR